MIIGTVGRQIFESFTIFQKGRKIAGKYEYLMLPRIFPDKVTPDIDFTGKTVAQWDGPVVKIVFYALVMYKSSQINFDVNT